MELPLPGEPITPDYIFEVMSADTNSEWGAAFSRFRRKQENAICQYLTYR